MSEAKEISKPDFVKEFFDQATSTLSYVVWDKESGDGLILDPVWDYDPASSTLSHFSAGSSANSSVEKLCDFLDQTKIRLRLILETHAHADHVTAAQVLKKKFPEARVGIGANIVKVQREFKRVFNLGSEFLTDGSQFDILMNEDKPIELGSLRIKTIFTPGHTPACASYLIEDCATDTQVLFVGDTLFMPDSGTGRCDFPGGDANELYSSIHERIYGLPDHTLIFTGHDYQPQGRPLQFFSTVALEKRENIHLRENTTKHEFVKFRTNRDKTLSAPRLLLPSIQINIKAGNLPKAEDNGVSYLKLPIL